MIVNFVFSIGDFFWTKQCRRIWRIRLVLMSFPSYDDTWTIFKVPKYPRMAITLRKTYKPIFVIAYAIASRSISWLYCFGSVRTPCGFVQYGPYFMCWSIPIGKLYRVVVSARTMLSARLPMARGEKGVNLARIAPTCLPTMQGPCLRSGRLKANTPTTSMAGTFNKRERLSRAELSPGTFVFYKDPTTFFLRSNNKKKRNKELFPRGEQK